MKSRNSTLNNEIGTSSQQLKHDLVLLELTQKAGLFYAKKTPEQKRFIMTKLFTNVTSSDAGVSVTYNRVRPYNS